MIYDRRLNAKDLYLDSNLMPSVALLPPATKLTHIIYFPSPKISSIDKKAGSN